MTIVPEAAEADAIFEGCRPELNAGISPGS
jgi:hypothetical protein